MTGSDFQPPSGTPRPFESRVPPPGCGVSTYSFLEMSDGGPEKGPFMLSLSPLSQNPHSHLSSPVTIISNIYKRDLPYSDKRKQVTNHPNQRK